MSIRWDPVLVRELARELDGELGGDRLRALRLDGASRDLVLLFRSRSLLWRLHPDRGWLRFGDALEPARADLRIRARVRGVTAPPDERLLSLELLPERGGANRLDLVVELIGNRWNAIVTEGPERVIRHVLVRREGRRPLLVGRRYGAPDPTWRLGADSELDAGKWLAALRDVSPQERERALVRTIAWTSPLNAATILGASGAGLDEGALLGAFERWKAIAGGTTGRPVLIEDANGRQPYPMDLTGVTQRPVESLLAAFAACADDARAAGDAPVALALGPDLTARLEEAVRQHERRVSRLRGELAGAEDAGLLRRIGDLILARYAEVGSGRDAVTLTDFDGAEIRVELDPALRPNENADRYYERAGRAERARERLPVLIEAAERTLARLEGLRSRALAGDADADEVRAALPERGEPETGGATAGLPYRSFRSSGGLEIRVGRGARHNDDLTFRHSAPGDVWLHARHTAGAHVVLRWPGDGAPPARDLREAATLAALHSKARTSGSVPVDWTYRKHVRKPRGASPGSVVPDRVSTLFVEPDEGLIERLAEGE
jgi:predicted ribosome quality control (RQC) complex YloA/Tae2 family protein